MTHRRNCLKMKSAEVKKALCCSTTTRDFDNEQWIIVGHGRLQRAPGSLQGQVLADGGGCNLLGTHALRRRDDNDL
jgi:hypothetical protein